METKCTGNSLNSSQGIAGVHVPFGAETGSAVSGEPGLCLLSPFHCSTFPLLQALFSFCFKLIWPQSKQYSCKDL